MTRSLLLSESIVVKGFASSLFANHFENMPLLHVILAHQVPSLYLLESISGNEGSCHTLERISPLRIMDLLELDRETSLKTLLS